MRTSSLGFAAPRYAKRLCQACCLLVPACERAGKRTEEPPVQAPPELEPAPRSSGSTFVSVRKASSPPYTIRKETEMPVILWLLGVPLVVIILLYLLNIV